MMTITGKTQLVGLLGWPVSHSRSPVMQTAAAVAAGVDLVYVTLPVHPEAVEAAVRGLPALGIRGANVTVPHKQAVMPYLDEIDPAAQALGAVNTIVVRPQGDDAYRPYLVGFNTDWQGFLTDLQRFGQTVVKRDCLILGAGGSARAIVYALAQAGGHVHVFARRPLQAQALVDDLSVHLPDAVMHAYPFAEVSVIAAQAVAPVIVNTTPLGMTPNVDTTPWRDGWRFPADSFVYDLVYTPAETRLMRQAQAAGCRAVSGLGMLLHQGAEAFHLWTGVEADVDVMRASIAVE